MLNMIRQLLVLLLHAQVRCKLLEGYFRPSRYSGLAFLCRKSAKRQKYEEKYTIICRKSVEMKSKFKRARRISVEYASKCSRKFYARPELASKLRGIYVENDVEKYWNLRRKCHDRGRKVLRIDGGPLRKNRLQKELNPPPPPPLPEPATLSEYYPTTQMEH